MKSRATAAIAAACALVISAQARAWCRTTTVPAAVPGQCVGSGTPLSWSSLCAGYSLYYAGSPDVALADIATEAAAAASTWNQAVCDPNAMTQPYFQMLALPDTSVPTGYDPNGPNANTVSFNSEWTEDATHRQGTIAITIVTFDTSTGQILDADTELNEQSAANPYGFHFTVGCPDPTSADLPTILTHEFGHFQGMAHSADPSAVMWPEAGLGEQRRALTDDDTGGICDAYNPANQPTGLECNPVPYGGFAASPHDPVVHGGCATAPLNAESSRFAIALASFAGLAFLRRRRRRTGEQA